MRRIFYFSSNGMKVFEWQRSRLLGSQFFKDDDQGLDEFEYYLENAPQSYSQLLVDVIEEDFRRESIPHVNPRDRQALINRLLDRHYRDEEHHQVRLLERSKSGRKDDQILLSALSNFDQINPWLSGINRFEVPLSGIWSVPLLTEDLLKVNKIKGENILLVTRELPWSQRETFFKNGRLIFSRLEKLDFNLFRNPDTEISLQCLQHGAEQIRHFLTNQRIVGFADEIKVLCLVPPGHLDICLNRSIDTPQIGYEFVNAQYFFAQKKIKGCEAEEVDAVFAWLCAQKNLFNDHYGRKNQKTHFYRYLTEKTISVASSLGAVLLLTLAALFFLESKAIDQQIDVANEGINVLQRRYDQEFGDLEHQLEDAYALENTVKHATLLNKESLERPQKYFSTFSDVYSRPLFKPLILDELYWVKHARTQIPQVVKALSGKRETDEYDESGGYVEIDETKELRQQPLVRMVGTLQRENLNYRQTVLVMREFVSALEALAIVNELHLVRTPVDIRPESRFSDKGGVEQASYAKNENADSFEVLLVLEPEVNATL